MNNTSGSLLDFFNVGSSTEKETVTMAQTLAALVELMPKGKNKHKAGALDEAECEHSQHLI